jgi:hypothetical protein
MVGADGYIGLADLPQEMFDDIRERLWLYTGSLFTPQPPHRYCGTCTFVSLAGVPHLLTAAHVWKRLLKEDGLALSVEERVQLHAIHHSVARPSAVLSPQGSADDRGPDMALVRLPAADASWIRVRKSFYNLDRHAPASAAEPPSYSLGLWAVIGCVAEQSAFGSTEALMGMRLFAASDPDVSEQDGFDYVDLRFDRQSRPNLPLSFGGISGAGLWQVKLLKSRTTGTVSVGSVHLEGVAFYQVPLTDHVGLIRCHGRKSLYSHAVAKAATELGK